MLAPMGRAAAGVVAGLPSCLAGVADAEAEAASSASASLSFAAGLGVRCTKDKRLPCFVGGGFFLEEDMPPFELWAAVSMVAVG